LEHHVVSLNKFVLNRTHVSLLRGGFHHETPHLLRSDDGALASFQEKKGGPLSLEEEEFVHGYY
jgi:hypothetical protein